MVFRCPSQKGPSKLSACAVLLYVLALSADAFYFPRNFFRRRNWEMSSSFDLDVQLIDAAKGGEVDHHKIGLVSGVFFSTKEAREAWTQRFMDECLKVEVSCQTRYLSERVVACDILSFDGFVEKCFESNHDVSHFLLDEDIFDSGEKLAALAKQVETLPPKLFPRDYFDFFPKIVRPKKPCLVMGGAGARSSLHADPMSWTGWNYLFEGSKIWTFFSANEPSLPQSELAALLKAKRRENNAWDAGVFNISAGWESSIDLYRKMKSGPGNSQSFPSASQLGRMSEVTECDPRR